MTTQGYQMGEELTNSANLAGAQTNMPPPKERSEAGCCGCKTSQGICNGGFERIDRNTLSFNPEERFNGVTKAYLDVHGGGDFFYYSSCCASEQAFTFKVLAPGVTQNSMEHLYSINNHLRCCCSCDDCNLGVKCLSCCCYYVCCNSNGGQLDYTFLGKTFATMGRYISPGCYNDCCSCCCGCNREKNINLVRFNQNSNDIDSTKGENVGLLYIPPGCCQANKVNYEYQGSKRYKIEVLGCCPALMYGQCCCCSGVLVINILDEMADGNPIVGKAIYRYGVYGTKYNEEGEEDTSYMLGNSTVDDTRKNCCVKPVNPHFVIHFPEKATSIDKFNIVNQIVYHYYYNIRGCCC